jgi:hypothetical protein
MQSWRPVKGGRFLPGASEPLTGRRLYLRDDREGEGAVRKQLCEFCRRPIVKRAVWPVVIVIVTPAFDLLPRIGEIEEHFHVQAFVAEPTVEALDEAVLDWLSRTNEIQLDRFSHAHRSMSRPANSPPLSIVIDSGAPRSATMRSSCSTTFFLPVYRRSACVHSPSFVN